MRTMLGILMISAGLGLGFVVYDWSSTPSTECGTKIAAVDDTSDEIGPAAYSVEVAFVQLAEVILSPGIPQSLGFSDSGCRNFARWFLAPWASVSLVFGLKFLTTKRSSADSRRLGTVQ